ncbi:hypothetical protein OAQ99_03965 [Candidatus Kapabacteria bacterium]|nr:hypothetical protein [Candidatus Kapabacteria bacterium]
MRKILFMIIASAIIFVGCDEGIGTKESDSKISNLTQSTSIVDNVGLTSYSNTIGLVVSPNIPIFYLGRRSKGCKRLGYCGRAFKWPWESSAPDVNTECVDCREVELTIAYDTLDNTIQPIELYLNADISSANSADKKFYVENEVRFAFDGNPFDSLVINSQTIDLDTSIGTFGGYTLNVFGVINP